MKYSNGGKGKGPNKTKAQGTKKFPSYPMTVPKSPRTVARRWE